MRDPLGFESHRPAEDYSALGGAARPWSGETQTPPDVKAALIKARKEYEICAVCTLRDCTHPYCGGKTGGRNKLDHDAARRLWAQGYTTAEIARRLGVSWSKVKSWQTREGRKPNPDTWGKLGRVAK